MTNSIRTKEEVATLLTELNTLVKTKGTNMEYCYRLIGNNEVEFRQYDASTDYTNGQVGTSTSPISPALSFEEATKRLEALICVIQNNELFSYGKSYNVIHDTFKLPA